MDNDSINNNNDDGDSTDYKQEIHADNTIVNGYLSNNQSFEYNDSFEVDDNDDNNVVVHCINVISIITLFIVIVIMISSSSSFLY